ncbi:hypothetical protein WJX77_012568 [Trebouxia sp. C0004]
MLRRRNAAAAFVLTKRIISSASGIKSKLLHWPPAPADWHESGAIYRITASSCKSGSLFLAQRLHTQAHTVPVNLVHLPHTGSARKLQPWLAQSGLLWIKNTGHYMPLPRLMWGTPWGWLPTKTIAEWALRPGSNTRIAIINAFQTVGGHVHRMLPIMVAEAFRQDRFASCLAGPGVQYVTTPSLLGVSWMLSLLHSIKRALSDFGRVIQLIWLLAPLACWAPLALGHGYGRQQWTRRFRTTLERLGPAFIKWGQWAATRHDMFPPDLCKELECLHTQAPVHSLHFTRSAIAQAFPGSVDELFEQFDEQPVASGSIAQVYKARLSRKGALHTGMLAGNEVAVKVRHPGVVRAIQRDFALMLRLAWLAALLPAVRQLRLQETLAQFAAPLQEQVDLSLEAQNLWQFNFNFRHDDCISFPLPIYPLVAPQVLVETFEAGEGISRYIADGSGNSPHDKQLAVLGHRAMLKMMLQHNFIHSDLHPGNIMVRLDPPSNMFMQAAAKLCSSAGLGCHIPNSWLRPKVVLLDVGMVTRLSEVDQHNMLGLFTSLSGMDGQGIANAVLSFSGEKQTCTNPTAFTISLTDYFARLKQADSWVDSQYNDVSDALSAVLELVRQHHVSLPGHICAVVVTTLVLEGWSSKLDPDQSIMDDIKQVVHADGHLPWKKYFAYLTSQL